MVAIPFWREFRTWVRGINPEAYIVGEVWWEDWKNDKMFNAAPWLGGDVFDAVMNYRWAREVDHFFKDDRFKTSPSEFARRLESLRRDYRSEANYVLMNLIDSHDTDRLASQIVNVDTKYDHNVGVRDNPDYNVRKPNAEEIRTQKLIALFQMSYLGAPMIYYGDEAGMWGADDPDERKPMLWSDMKYENESHHPFGKSRPDDKNEFNQALFTYYKRLIAVRRSHDALLLGDITPLLMDNERNVLALLRSHGQQHVAIVINNSMLAQSVSLPVKGALGAFRWVSLLDSHDGVTKAGSIDVTLDPKSGVLLEAKEQ
jgi:glycosidase